MASRDGEARRLARQREERVCATTFAVIGVIVLGLAGYLLVAAFVRPALPPLAGKVIDVSATMSGIDEGMSAAGARRRRGSDGVANPGDGVNEQAKRPRPVHANRMRPS